MNTVTVTTAEEFEAVVGKPLADYHHNCHAASLALVRALGRGRVARGRSAGILSQHSWMVDGEDCYAPNAKILDPTRWSYRDEEPYVWTGTAADRLHVPHGGVGNIWDYGRPDFPQGEQIALTVDISDEAQNFLDFAAPAGLDRKGWQVLLHAPVRGWPAKEIITAAYQTEALRALIPVDIVGMITDLNPEGLYR